MTEKIKTINNKIEQNNAHYDLDKQVDQTSALSLGNVNKYEFLIDKDVLPEKDLLEKAATIKRFEYLLLGKEVKAQTGIAKKQYKGLDKIFEFDETRNKYDQKPALKKYDKSDLIYGSNHTFYKYYRDNKNLITFLLNQNILF